MKIESQNKRILKFLQSGRKLTPYGALMKFDCFRLSARIHNLRKAGHDIQMELITSGGKTFSEYKIAQS